MRGRRTQRITAGMAVFFCLLLMAASSYATEVVIGSNSTDIGRIIFVSPKPGDPALTNGDALVNTLGRITDASAENPYLIKLGAGTYDLGTIATGLQMKEYVSIEGSGEKTTKITAAVNSGSWTRAATVMGANNAELRYLTVENTGTGLFTAGILNTSASPSLIHVTAIASGGTSQNYGVRNDDSSSPTMTNVTATASGAISYGVYNWDGSSPTMTNITATAMGTGSSTGVINNWACSSTMRNVKATASGATSYNRGVENSSSSPVMTNVIATASGGTNSYGVYNYVASLTMENVTATASGGTNNYGVYSDGSVLPARIVRISHSVITGATNTIFNGSGVITLVRHTQLDGEAVSNAGTLTCAGSYNSKYNVLNASCQ